MEHCKHRVMDRCKKSGNPCTFSEDCFEPEVEIVKTNAERIRSMSDDELAIFQAKMYAKCVFLEKEKNEIILTESARKALIDDLYRIWIRYLKQPADD